MITHYQQYEIEVIDDEGYVLNSTDNKNHYQNVIHDPADVYQPSAKHGIRVKEHEVEISSVVIYASGGITRINARSPLIKDDIIFICCTNSVYALQVPSLDLIWKNNLDLATCFCIYEFDGDLLIHGETQISRIAFNGDIKWTFSGRDIFLTLDEKPPIEFSDNKIILRDFLGYEYHLDADGRLINDNYTQVN
ncbi:hypothetical protein [Mucilaginibacter polytrichastri]|uniref:Uncharacterized protein n=1 Tax=Mucilaginibacter polytrichastri TaxID=1302689 RepID=A0A1Q6A555_9SPHI|nr:hypothetical protein [Mucilaginibacter polytrichastri]OKS89133.1 hypothetical protein RG47T_4614 [Mucilaginibacter polytrichastri]SFS96934.1 hypothetical protein SAMN04487890_107171 [Mucilaginibacter polytrichastri]